MTTRNKAKELVRTLLSRKPAAQEAHQPTQAAHDVSDAVMQHENRLDILAWEVAVKKAGGDEDKADSIVDSIYDDVTGVSVPGEPEHAFIFVNERHDVDEMMEFVMKVRSFASVSYSSDPEGDGTDLTIYDCTPEQLSAYYAKVLSAIRQKFKV